MKLYYKTGRRGITKGCVKVEVYRLLMAMCLNVISDCITHSGRLDIVVINTQTNEILAIIWCKNVEGTEIRKGKRYFKYNQYDCPLFVVPNLDNAKQICLELVCELRMQGHLCAEKYIDCKNIIDNFQFNPLLF